MEEFMKKKIAFVLAILFVLCVACGCTDKALPTYEADETGVHAGDTASGGRWFDARVLSVSSGSLMVMPLGESFERDSAGEAGISLSTRLKDGSTASGFARGDVIRVVYGGEIAESYPVQIFGAVSIEKIN